MDLIVLADKTGVVDMTPESISRTTNVPLEMILHALDKLTQPDPKSRSNVEEGRRLMLIDSHRDWGWQIVNYEHYRNIIDEESRRAYHRDRKRVYRSKLSQNGQNVPECPGLSQSVPQKSTEAHAEAEAEAKAEAKTHVCEPPSAHVSTGFHITEEIREWAKRMAPHLDVDAEFTRFGLY